jgi:hypothetical protein
LLLSIRIRESTLERNGEAVDDELDQLSARRALRVSTAQRYGNHLAGGFVPPGEAADSLDCLAPPRPPSVIRGRLFFTDTH